MKKVKVVRAWAQVNKKSRNIAWWSPPTQYAIFSTEKQAQQDLQFQDMTEKWEIVEVEIRPITKKRRKKP